ncbi:cathepsin S [Microcaecilia unicolor]|uniref:Cathepsin S-like n=1 Tax=Microcaecilia unicolor TaxID=1415580 RepID=A0A6P7ZMU7_9AMPH|nr:cathepsin S-like [Microcaecilia unicolor]XP_030078293.1 cathepsin S-like [Microcaecilia unicolor]
MYSEKFLLILAFALAYHALALESLDNEWKLWKSNYGRKYSSKKEEEFRRITWETNWQKVQKHNQLADQGKKSYWMKMNHFADKSENELKRMDCLHLPPREERKFKNYQDEKYRALPPNVDWREKKCVTAVKNQEACGSCWAFATVGTIESRYCIKYGPLVELSEQQLVDCSYENGGCCGGFPDAALDYVLDNGLMKSSSYKYKGYGSECRYKHRQALALNSSKFYNLATEDNIASALASDGPMSITFAVHPNFQLYDRGIYDDECAEYSNHAMLVVGYGSLDYEQYWIVKNSWGHYWGENGYVKIRRNVNLCNIGEWASAADLM